MAHCHAAKASTSWMRARRIEGSLRHRLLLAGLAGFLPTKNSPAPPILFARVNLTRGETLPLLWQSPALVCASSFTFTGSVLPLLQVEALLLTRRSGVCCTSCRVEHFQKACDIPTSALREGAGYLGLMPSLAVPAPSTLPRSTSSRLVALFASSFFCRTTRRQRRQTGLSGLCACIGPQPLTGEKGAGRLGHFAFLSRCHHSLGLSLAEDPGALMIAGGMDGMGSGGIARWGLLLWTQCALRSPTFCLSSDHWLTSRVLTAGGV